MAPQKGKKTLSKTRERKKEHLELCLEDEAVAFPHSAGLDNYTFVHNALPELDIADIDLGTTFSAIAYVNRHGVPEILPNAEGDRITPSVILFEDD
ncbi:MAG: Hsp70 family protein, partial [Candidatus Binatia bacterium]